MILNLLLFALMLFVVVMIHEFGHLITAKMFGVYCQEFSFGMGPKLWSIKGKETTYSIRALPLGGFVSMAGDNDNPIEPSVVESLPPERTLKGIAPWKKIIVMYAGIFMNIVLAFVITSCVLLHLGYYSASPDTTLASVEPGYPAEKAGIEKGDRILGITMTDGSYYGTETFAELSSFLSMYDGNGSIGLSVEKTDGSQRNYTITPIFVEEQNAYFVGISSYQYKLIEVNIFNCLKYAGIYLWSMVRMIFGSLLNLLRGIGFSQVSGPVGIYKVTSEAVESGLDVYFNLVALISLNIGLFNALPLPIMDGGRVLITVVEMIIRKPLNEKFENAIMMLSVFLLLVLLVFATAQDILRLF